MEILPGKYRHFKGGLYEVISMARHSEIGEEMVVYRALYGDGGWWVRPAAMWNETVRRDGVTYRRFTRIEDPEPTDGYAVPGEHTSVNSAVHPTKGSAPTEIGTSAEENTTIGAHVPAGEHTSANPAVHPTEEGAPTETDKPTGMNTATKTDASAEKNAPTGAHIPAGGQS